MLIDPFLHELVLQHFVSSEVLKVLSFVSVEWSHMIGKSKKCMSRVKFLYQVWRHQFYSSTEVFRSAQESWRDYQHLTIELGVNDDSKEFWKLMESCCKSVVSLKVENIRRRANDDCSIEFPNLETFIAFGVDDTAMMTFLNASKKMKHIFIFSTDELIDPSVIQSITKCIQRNRRLQELYLKNVNFLSIFEEELEVPFQLKTLKLMNTSATDTISNKIEQNLLKFLKQQSSTLETFFFEFQSDEVTKLTFNNMPTLTSAGLLKLPREILDKNQRIVNLEIPFIDEFADIKKLIDATPNIETLFVGEVKKELVDYLAWNFIKLKSLNFKMIELDAEEHYEQLKVDCPEVNQDIEIWDYENVDWD